MDPFDVLVVGPVERSTGGVARYVDQQRRHLPATIRPTLHDDGTTDGDLKSTVGRSLTRSLYGALGFPRHRVPDVVHVHASHGLSFYRASWYVLYADRVWERPVVLHVHGSSFDRFVTEANVLSRRAQGAVFEASDAVVVLSEYWREQLAGRVPGDKLVVLPNAIEADEFEPSFETDGPPTVVFVSNLVRRKGLEELIAAIDRLAERGGPEFGVDLAGDGPLSDDVRALANRRDAVTCHGYVSEDEKRRLLNRGDVYVLPSHAEGLPIALLEGMAGGNAVVSTTVGSIPEVVDEENGYLVSPGDVTELTSSLAALLSDPATVAEMGRANRQLVVDAYSWTAVADGLCDLYRSMLDGRTDLATVGTRRTVSGS